LNSSRGGGGRGAFIMQYVYKEVVKEGHIKKNS